MCLPGPATATLCTANAGEPQIEPALPSSILSTPKASWSGAICWQAVIAGEATGPYTGWCRAWHPTRLPAVFPTTRGHNAAAALAGHIWSPGRADGER